MRISIALFIRYCDDHFKEDLMELVCERDGRDEKYMQYFERKA
jgi:hypothetical protein